MENKKEYYVYQLIDDRDDTVFYVGKGQKKRMYHYVEAVSHGRHISNFDLELKIKDIIKASKVKYTKIFKTYNEQEAYNMENEVIEKIGLENLCNKMPGGGGGHSKELNNTIFTVRINQETFDQLHSTTMTRLWEYENIDNLSQFIRMLLLKELRKAGLR